MDTGSTLTKATATLLAALAIQPGTAPQDTSEEPVVATAPTEEVVEIVIDPQGRWAVEAFENAGLEFPQVNVLLHETKDACRGNVGGYSGDTVHVCITAEGLYRDKILLHELGHAWAARNLTDGQMAEFIELRDAESWNDSGTEWGDRGFEQAAEILAWGLLETATTPTQISDSDCDSLTNAFQLLTNTEVPRDQVCS